MKEPREEIWTYHVKFSVGTAHYETTIQAYGKDVAKKLLKAQYPNQNVVVKDEDIIMEPKKYKVPSKEDGKQKET